MLAPREQVRRAHQPGLSCCHPVAELGAGLGALLPSPRLPTAHLHPLGRPHRVAILSPGCRRPHLLHARTVCAVASESECPKHPFSSIYPKYPVRWVTEIKWGISGSPIGEDRHGSHPRTWGCARPGRRGGHVAGRGGAGVRVGWPQVLADGLVPADRDRHGPGVRTHRDAIAEGPVLPAHGVGLDPGEDRPRAPAPLRGDACRHAGRPGEVPGQEQRPEPQVPGHDGGDGVEGNREALAEAVAEAVVGRVWRPTAQGGRLLLVVHARRRVQRDHPGSDQVGPEHGLRHLVGQRLRVLPRRPGERERRERRAQLDPGQARRPRAVRARAGADPVHGRFGVDLPSLQSAVRPVRGEDQDHSVGLPRSARGVLAVARRPLLDHRLAGLRRDRRHRELLGVPVDRRARTCTTRPTARASWPG